MRVHRRYILTPDDNTMAKSTSGHRIALIFILIQYKINNSNNICARCSFTDHNRDGRENPFESLPPHTPLLYVLFNGRL